MVADINDCTKRKTDNEKPRTPNNVAENHNDAKQK